MESVFPLVSKTPKTPPPVGGSDRVVFINSHLHQLCICVLWFGREMGGGGGGGVALGSFSSLCYKHGVSWTTIHTVWQMKDICSRQLVLMCMESDGNGGGRASHSAVWRDRKWEDHSIATVPV